MSATMIPTNAVADAVAELEAAEAEVVAVRDRVFRRDPKVTPKQLADANAAVALAKMRVAAAEDAAAVEAEQRRVDGIEDARRSLLGGEIAGLAADALRRYDEALDAIKGVFAAVGRYQDALHRHAQELDALAPLPDDIAVDRKAIAVGDARFERMPGKAHEILLEVAARAYLDVAQVDINVRGALLRAAGVKTSTAPTVPLWRGEQLRRTVEQVSGGGARSAGGRASRVNEE